MDLSQKILGSGALLFLLFLLPRLLKSLGVPYILGFMLLGLMGKLFLDKETAELFEFFEISAVILLFFFIGLEYSFERLKGMAKVWKAGGVDFALNFIPVFLLSYTFTGDLFFSLIMASVLYPSSTSIVAKLLMDYRRLILPEAELLIGILIFEDLVSIILLSLFTPLSHGSEISLLTPLKSAFFVLLVFGSFYLISKHLVRRGMKFLDRLAEDSIMPFFVLGVLLLLSGLAHGVGLSEALIAFMLGVLIPEDSKLFHAIENQFSSLKELSVGIFFFFFTYEASLSTDIDYLFFSLLFALALFLKLISTFIGGRLYGFNDRTSLRASLSFLPRGEFSVIFSGLNPATQNLTLLLVMITSFLGSLSFVIAPRMVDKVYPRKKPLRVPPAAP